MQQNNRNFWACLVCAFIYLGFCSQAAKSKGWDSVLDKVWIVVALFAPSPVSGDRK